MDDAERIEKEVLEPAGSAFRSMPSLLRVHGRTLVIGDLHGDLRAARSAVEMFKKAGHAHLLFLGDYVDRGKDSLPVLELLIGEMLKDPEHIHLLRGNHETLWVNDENGFSDELRRRGLANLHMPINEMFSQMPLAAVIDGVTFAVHGGVPQEIPSLDDIKAVRKGVIDPHETSDRLMLGLMWNDPKESLKGFAPNTHRGYMYVFGRQAFIDFLRKNELKGIVRGHQRWPDGHKYFFERQLLSVFSCASYSPDVRTKAVTIDGAEFSVIEL